MPWIIPDTFFLSSVESAANYRDGTGFSPRLIFCNEIVRTPPYNLDCVHNGLFLFVGGLNDYIENGKIKEIL